MEVMVRGKRMDNHEWIEGTYVTTCHNDDIVHFIIPNGSDLSRDVKVKNVLVEVIPETVGRYTGLLDKVDKRIFEGDICRSSLGTAFVVEWDEENARFIGYTTGNKRRMIYVSREPKVEVIGSVYDDSELIKATEK